ncbi:TetR/AcrR family transcriptional regulator [Enterovirga aerilata]|uniref:TetR/AcrR family transcriptional regulator n=1 Tax=Enterovirga aerilata TaxID=2730920 RepID=UPI001AEE44DC
MSRSDRVKANRVALMRAAADLIGERGYEETSVGRITERAGLAHGTFYRYFESRQDLFDELLPTVGNELLQQLRARVSGARDVLDLEERGFRGFFDFLVEHPGFYRLLNEAETAAPAAFQEHIDNLARHYVSALERSRARGELPGFEARELEVLAFILMAARFYIYLRFSKVEGGAGPIPDWVVAAYMKFVTFGLAGAPPERTRKSAPEADGTSERAATRRRRSTSRSRASGETQQ